jgi:hypothetical protein
MLLLLLLAPLVGGAVYAMSAVAAARARTRPIPRVEEVALRMEGQGFRRVVEAERDRAREETAPGRAVIRELADEERRRAGRVARHVTPTLAAHPHLIAYVIPLALGALIGLVMLNAGIALDIGLLETLDIATSQARVIGTIVALTTGLVGLLIMELLFPGEGIPALKGLHRPVRLGWVAGLATALAAVLVLLSVLAMARAEARLGEAVDRAAATCEEVAADPSAGPGERTLACSTAERRRAQLERAKLWDSLVAVAAPLGEAVGLWALLRLAEVGVAGAIALAVQRSRRQLMRARARLDQASDAFVALMARAAEEARIPQEEVEEWRREMAVSEEDDRRQDERERGIPDDRPPLAGGAAGDVDPDPDFTGLQGPGPESVVPPASSTPTVSFIPPAPDDASNDGDRWAVS